MTEPLNPQLEQSIREAEAMRVYMESKGEEEHIRVGLWAKFIEIHKGRTPAHVAAMEKEAGLE